MESSHQSEAYIQQVKQVNGTTTNGIARITALCHYTPYNLAEADWRLYPAALMKPQRQLWTTDHIHYQQLLAAHTPCLFALDVPGVFLSRPGVGGPNGGAVTTKDLSSALPLERRASFHRVW